MNLSPLSAISPIDGRYRNKCQDLAPYFSEHALIQYRVRVEVEYLISLYEFIPQAFKTPIGAAEQEKLRGLYVHFTEQDAQQIKDIERTTNHDVKAVEYFIKSQLTEWGWDSIKEWVHFGLTSQDINNTAVPLMIKEAHEQILIPQIEQIIEKLSQLSSDWKQVPMLARTHGQPASPTMLGKELWVFVHRLQGQISLLKSIPFSAKFGGATGNLNAHHVAFAQKDWIEFANQFVTQSLGLNRTQVTTQIEPYDNTAAYFDNFKRIHTILIDLCRDIWTYISMNYFNQKIKEGEVGSSAMPHKVNPIDFENAEGNLGIANALLNHLSEKLPISRLQRDLTDSTVLRNVGVPLSHGLIAYQSILKGLNKITLNQESIDRDLDQNWAVVAEAIQTVLRAQGYPNPYETLKELTRKNEKMTPASLEAFIDSLDIDSQTQQQLKQISPFNYTGIQPQDLHVNNKS